MADPVRQPASAEEVYGYLQQDALNLISWLALGLSWLAIAAFFRPAYYRDALPWLPAPGLVLVASALALTLNERHYRLAASLLIAALIVADGVLLRAFRDAQVLYAAALVISLASYLSGQRLAAAATAGVVALGVFGLHSGLPARMLAGPMLLCVLTLVVGRLSAHHLYMTLAWAWESFQRSLERTEEARRDRARLAGVSKSLEEAYARLQRANEALAQAWQTAEEARRYKALFAANISHELRTPLSIIVGFAETMLFAPESYGRELPAVYRSDLIEIYNSSRHLLGLIDDVLDLSQIEAGRMGLVKEPTDLAEVIREAAEMLQRLAQRKGLYLRVEIEEPLPILELDRTRIRQVLLNLLNNGVRYTERGGITVQARVEDEQLRVSVADTGPGISPENLQRIFESFYQVDASVSRRHGGIGLGLALSRYFIEMHGGRIWAESQPGVGSCFSFSLPLEREVRERGERRAPLLRSAFPQAIGDGRQVLVIHPDPTTAVMLQRHLDGTRVAHTADLKAAAQELERTRPRAVIADTASLPEILRLAGDGEGGQGGSGLPGTLLIGCSLPSGPLPAVALGVRGFLVKPVSRQNLLATLESCAPGARRVLVVDDDPRVVRLLARMLFSLPGRYEILRAFDGQEALSLMRTERPDAVLLDLYMPQLDGFSVLEHMEADPVLSTIPVVVVSAKGLPDDGVLRLQGPITIQQPGGFSLAELLRYLQAVLDAAGPPGAGQPSG